MSRITQVFARRRLYRDLSEEMREHLEEKIDELVASGMSREDATRAARREFGNVTLLEERSREVWRWPSVEDFFMDAGYGLRILAKNPALTAVAILTLALGIGANTVVFSSVNAMLLHPFAFQDLDRAMAIWETAPKQDRDHISAAPANFLDWHEWNRSSRTFDLVAASHGWDVNLTGSGMSERVEGSQVTADFFPLLGIAPELGRSVAASDFEPGHGSVVVLSHGFWQRHLGADPQIVGRKLLLNGATFTVIGVMPGDFDFPVGVEAWAPLDLTGAPKGDRAGHYLNVIGRLRAGVSMTQAEADLNGVASRLARQYPATNADHGVRVIGLVKDVTFGSDRFLLTLMGAAIFVLLLASANVANLELAQALARHKEIALRMALGAGRWRIVRQLLVEGVLVSTLGALASLVLSWWGLELSRRSIPAFIVQHIPGVKHMVIDARVLIFTLAIGVGSGIAAALAPALQALHSNVNDVLKEGGRGGGAGPARSRLRAALVTSEVALAMVLLVGAGLMVKGFHRLRSSDLGFDRRHVLTFYIALAENKYRDAASIRGFYGRILERLQTLPGAESAAASTSLPAGWSWDSTAYRGENQPPAAPGELRVAFSQSISPDFFRAVRVPLVGGRFFTTGDGPESPPVAIVSNNLAHRIWGDQNAVGRRIRLGSDENKEPWRTVVGVVADLRQSSFDDGPHLSVYVPFAQVPRAASGVMVRTTGDPDTLAAAARAAVQEVDSDQPAYDLRTLEQRISDNDSGVESSANMMAVFGAIALVLAAAGIFAVMVYSVRQRTHEIGLRMALGAQRRDVFGLVAGHAVKLAAIGLAIGIPCALALTRALSSLLFGVVRMEMQMFVGFAALLAAAAVLAAYVPARSATRVDPMVALRHE